MKIPTPFFSKWQKKKKKKKKKKRRIEISIYRLRLQEFLAINEIGKTSDANDASFFAFYIGEHELKISEEYVAAPQIIIEIILIASFDAFGLFFFFLEGAGDVGEKEFYISFSFKEKNKSKTVIPEQKIKNHCILIKITNLTPFLSNLKTERSYFFLFFFFHRDSKYLGFYSQDF